MGRLVDPISQEEFDKLPKWQQWTSNNIYWVLIAIAAIGVAVFFISRL